MSTNIRPPLKFRTCKVEWLDWLRKVKEFTGQAKSNLSPLLANVENDSRPYIKVKIFNEVHLALIDTGANNSVVGKIGNYWIKKYGLTLHESPFQNIMVADDTRRSVSGELRLPITLNNSGSKQKFISNVLVVPSLSYSLILGSDFLRENNFELKLGRNEFVCGNVSSLVGIRGKSQLSDSERELLSTTIEKFKKLGNKKIGKTSIIEHEIDTGDAKAIKQRHYSLSPYMQQIMNKEIDEMLDLGVIRESKSEWASPVLFVKKQNEELRFCFDGRKLNAVTKRDAYPLPFIDSILSKLRDARYLTSIDLRKAFWQIPLTEKSCEKTAFVVPGKGLFEFVRMPFGLHNAAQTQQRLMDKLFGPELEPFVFTYLDDIIISTENFEHHIEILNKVYDRLKYADLVINIDKCNFCRNELKYLGFVVNENGLKTSPDKIESMLKFPIPTTTTEIKRFLGLCSWYRRFIKDFASLVSPINDLLKKRKKNKPIEWNERADGAINELKQRLISAPVLVSPDFKREFKIQCDASNFGLGAVLTQDFEDGEKVIAFASRSLTNSERKYSATEKECLAIIFAVEKFRMYIEGTKFTVITDHYSLLWLKELKNPTARLARWALKLDEYDMQIVHRKGKANIVPDALSRAVNDEDVKVCTFSTMLKDGWYTKQTSKISKNPERYPDWKLVNDVLYKLVPNRFKIPLNVPEWKMVVPCFEREEIIRRCHDDLGSGHFGFYKTLKKVQINYYWPNVKKDVIRFVRSCIVCGSQKSPNYPPSGLMKFEKKANFPFEIIAMDLIGPLPRSKSGHRWLLVITDFLTKYVILQPFREATAAAISKFVDKYIFTVYGVPRVVMTDNGTQFISKEFKKIIEKYEVANLWYNAKYHPQVNFCERTNRVVLTLIRSYLKENDHRTWDAEINYVMAAINSAPNEVTKFSPNALMFGRDVPINGKIYKDLNMKELMKSNEINEYITKLKELPKVYTEVAKSIHKAHERNAKRYNVGRQNNKLAVGDLVWRKNFSLSNAASGYCAKLAPKYVLNKVTKVNSSLVYTLENTNGKNEGRWHIKHLKPYHETNDEESRTGGIPMNDCVKLKGPLNVVERMNE